MVDNSENKVLPIYGKHFIAVSLFAECSGGLGRECGVIVYELYITVETVASGEVLYLCQQEGGGFLAVDAIFFRLGYGTSIPPFIPSPRAAAKAAASPSGVSMR